MRVIFSAVIAAFLELSSAAIASERVETDACSEYSQAEMRQCLKSKANESDAALKHAQQSTRDAISRWDEEPQYVALAIKRFDESTVAFEQLRLKRCAFEASLGGGAIGAALETRRLKCFVKLNRIHLEWLREDRVSLR